MARFMSAFFLLLFPIVAAAQSQQAQEGQSSSEQPQQEQPAVTGLGDVVRTVGMARLQGGTASGQYEQARQLYIQNQAKAVATYFEMRRYQRQHKASAQTSPFSSEQYIRQAREQSPDRLRPTQLDPLTGDIRWPESLMRPGYAPQRGNLERLFVELRADYPVTREIQKACEQFQAQLKTDVATFDANSYIAARQFLQSLHYEAGMQNY